jgi:hypothetical protein
MAFVPLMLVKLLFTTPLLIYLNQFSPTVFFKQPEFVSVNGYAPSIEEEDVDFFLNIDKAKLQPINRQLDELYTLMKSVESESERVPLSRIKHILEFTYTIPVESIAEKEEK